MLESCRYRPLQESKSKSNYLVNLLISKHSTTEQSLGMIRSGKNNIMVNTTGLKTTLRKKNSHENKVQTCLTISPKTEIKYSVLLNDSELF